MTTLQRPTRAASGEPMLMITKRMTLTTRPMTMAKIATTFLTFLRGSAGSAGALLVALLMLSLGQPASAWAQAAPEP
ncbi:MAG TPA: hypothetical protein PKU97_18265, partial [Kofleriaceae bacterium]|nr:hypothetical protein [Kofleriaceae bacterium]